jgi:hypothetical protein
VWRAEKVGERVSAYELRMHLAVDEGNCKGVVVDRDIVGARLVAATEEVTERNVCYVLYSHCHILCHLNILSR